MSRDMVFFFRVKDTDDRDRCAYIENTYHLDCIDEVILEGACYSGRSFGLKDLKYEDVETVLSKKDFETLYGKNVSKDDFDRIVKKLTSAKGQAFFQTIVEDEMNYLKETFDLTDEDIEAIFNEYTLSYKDRAVVGHVFKDYAEYGEEEAWSLGYKVPDIMEDCIDYDAFGRKLADDMDCVILSGDRIATLCY